MDVEALLDDAAVLLDLTETSLERIIHTILTKGRILWFMGILNFKS